MDTKKQVTTYLNEVNYNFITDACKNLGLTRSGYLNLLIHNLIQRENE